MRSTPARLAPLAVLTTLALAAPATPAMARTVDKQAPVITGITVNPSPVVLRVKSGGRTTFSVAVRATDVGVGVDRVTVGLYDPRDSAGRAFRLSRTGGSAAEGLWTGLVSLPNSVRSGTWALRAFATDEASNTTNPDAVYTNFRVLLKTRLPGIALAADRASGTLSPSARLERFRPGKGWEPFVGRTIALEFQPQGGKAFKKVKTATTDARGKVAFGKVPFSESGTWRMTYAGHPNYGPSTSSSASFAVAAPATPAPTPVAAG